MKRAFSPSIPITRLRISFSLAFVSLDCFRLPSFVSLSLRTSLDYPSIAWLSSVPRLISRAVFSEFISIEITTFYPLKYVMPVVNAIWKEVHEHYGCRLGGWWIDTSGQKGTRMTCSGWKGQQTSQNKTWTVAGNNSYLISVRKMFAAAPKMMRTFRYFADVRMSVGTSYSGYGLRL